ncbi:MAG: hypothetical protein DRQ78_12435 [Epsilonproteobacteria bacterium]|nr:MAG: hypothetical protein DRQ78_12435 [Campylobacterota bacterium]
MNNFKIQIRISHLRRSGSHAIINWIASLYDKNRVAFHHQKKRGFVTTFKDDLEIKKMNHIPYLRNRKTIECDVFIYNNEESDLLDVSESISESHRNNIFGDTEFVYDVVILRDPLNNFASMFESNLTNLSKPAVRYKIVNMWKQYAYECMGKTTILPYKLIPISYNLWCVSKGYREFIASLFYDSTFSDDQLHIVSTYGRGSSFDKNHSLQQTLLNVPSDAHELLHSRYELFNNDQSFKYFHQDNELMELSKEIFGIEYNI